jgi:hypothetical protein
MHEAKRNAAATSAATIEIPKANVSDRSAISLTDLKPAKKYAFVSSGRRGPSQVYWALHKHLPFNH